MLRLLKHLLGLHRHYFGIPHKRGDGKTYVTCYGCSKTKRLGVEL